ncbi:MAG: hypothetical protein KGJ43_06965, partial [Acidobacteriota bacterium]|nr:hypothetical protein [Acidobacteriota bacterium]
IGAGVVIGSNVFKLAALLGLAALLAGHIALHRRVVIMEGVVALAVAAVALLAVMGLVSPMAGLALVATVLLPYLAAVGMRRDHLRRLPIPRSFVRWLALAIVQEELELQRALHPRRGRGRDAMEALAALLVVAGAGVALERAAATLGSHQGIPTLVTGALVLGAVTSLPNAVAAVYLARRGRGSATLSTAMNSNALNVAVGLLLPAAIAGLGKPSAEGTMIAVWYLALTALSLAIAYANRGLNRANGALILAAYMAFTGTLLATA